MLSEDLKVENHLAMSTEDADARILEDLHHQLRTPIAGAFWRIDAALARNNIPPDAQKQLRAARSLLARA